MISKSFRSKVRKEIVREVLKNSNSHLKGSKNSKQNTSGY